MSQCWQKNIAKVKTLCYTSFITNVLNEWEKGGVKWQYIQKNNGMQKKYKLWKGVITVLLI